MFQCILIHAALRRIAWFGNCRYSIVLKTTLEFDGMKVGTAEQSWNLQGWLSVGSHKLVQQTLRALVRKRNHPYEVRESV